MTYLSRRRFFRGSLGLVGLGLLSGCGSSSVPWQPASGKPKVSRIGYLTSTTPAAAELEAFRDGLRELGYVDGDTIVIEVRRAEGSDQYEAPAAELVALPVDLIVTPGGGTSTVAAMSATRTIPIVFAASPDPVGNGIVASLARPGGNVTGVSGLATQAEGKRLQLLRELMPGVARVMYLTPVLGSVAGTGTDVGLLGIQAAEQAAQSLGVHPLVPGIRTGADLADAFQMAVVEHAEALWITASPTLAREVGRIMEFATAQRLPVLSATRIYADAGGLIFYGPNRLAQFRRSATYVDRILKGANPAEMPVEQPTEFELAINLRTAQALGITVPRSVLDQATEVIH